MRRTHLSVVLLGLAACRPAAPVRTGPLPDAHSCYALDGPLTTQGGTARAWLQLSDQSRRLFGARSFDASIWEDGRITPAAWHATAGDSLRVEWTDAVGRRVLALRVVGDRLAGALSSGDTTLAARAVAGRRVACAAVGERRASELP